MATIAIVIILLFLDTLRTTAIIASLGASTFIKFTTPNSYLARPRPFLGGYLIGIITGLLAWYLANFHFFVKLIGDPQTTTVVFGGIAVGMAIFLMSITSTEHAPASGVALGLVINTWDYRTILFILGAITFLTVIGQLLKPYLLDLREL